MNTDRLAVDESLIRKVADLALLDLSAAEVQRYVQSISDILMHVDQLKEVNTDGVEPMIHGIDGNLILREDTVIDFGSDDQGQPKILQSAPSVTDGGYTVPPIII